MSLPTLLRDRLRLPVIGAPMFIVSGPELVLAQCNAGIVGSFPALNARPEPTLDKWLTRISKELQVIRRSSWMRRRAVRRQPDRALEQRAAAA